MKFPKKHKNEISEYEASFLMAKTKQEEAIAERIRNSPAVHIEEYYDASNTEGLGVSANQNGINTQLNAVNQRVSKRIYHFQD